MLRHCVVGAVVVLAASAGVGALAPSAGAAPTVGIRVDAGTSLGTVPSSGFGLNTGYGDEHMGSAKATSLMKAAGVRQLRYPGGSGADDYHWKTHTYGDGSGWIPSNTDFDHFMAIAKKVGAQPILTANYGSGTPKEAADWVKYANVDKGYGVKYWEIGNEVYGNGHYGKCEPPRDTPFPTYWGIRSLTALAQPGDTMVKSSSRNSSVAVHAVRSSNGRLKRHADEQEPAERGAGVALVRRIHPGRRGGHDRFVCQGRHLPDDGEAGYGGRTEAAAVLDHDSSAEARVGDRRR
jgi:hypothetical protein